MTYGLLVRSVRTSDGLAGIGLIVFLAASFFFVGPILQGLADWWRAL